MSRLFSHLRTVRASESGSTFVIVSAGIVGLLASAALVIDLGMIRASRASAQIAVDAAASAGAMELRTGTGEDACNAALGYLELNLEGNPTFSGIDCSYMPTTCSDTTGAVTGTDNSGDWTLDIVHPVPDDHDLMESSAVGATSQAIHTRDGSRCHRIGVLLEHHRETTFAGVVGVDSTTTEVSAVGRGQLSGGPGKVINLLLLERFDCDVMHDATSGNGGLIIDAVFNPDAGRLEPGYVAVDSDASGSCSNEGVIDTAGSNGLIRADGPAGCPGELGTHVGAGGLTVGEGCGTIEVLAPGTPGCNMPACTEGSGTIAPHPRALKERLTRAAVDHRYNCKAAYPMPAGWEIEGCLEAPAPHIDQLVATLGTPGTTPPGYQTWTGLGEDCTFSGPPGTTITVSGNIRVDCFHFDVRRAVHFTGGNVIFDNRVTLSGNAELTVNGTIANPYVAASGQAIAYMRDGKLSKAGGAELHLHNTMVYLSATSELSLSGGEGALRWQAPLNGDFEDLALWSESGLLHDFSGGAVLDLEGVFFAPWALIKYTGSGGTQQVSAQFIARRLHVGGSGELVIRPGAYRAITFGATIQLIR